MTEFRSSARLDVLRKRASLLHQTREFFHRRDFLEVQTPLLSADTVVDRHLDPIPVHLPADAYSADRGRALWLQTSPEFAMKRLVACGATAVYQVAPAFRIGECGQFHNPEFTLVEWYRCGDDTLAGIALLSELVEALLGIDAVDICTMREAFQHHAGFDPLRCSAGQLRELCRAKAIPLPATIAASDWDSWFDLLFASLVQPHLGRGGAGVVRDYPASQAALAVIRDDDPPVAERFELFVEGVELANGYQELLDAEELLRRNQDMNKQRIQDGKSPLPEESRLLDAMRAGMPPCTGVALGFDRLVMLAVGVQTIGEVVAFPIDRA